MAVQGRRFGKPHPLQKLMERGEEFFDAILATDIDEVLERSKRIGKIATIAADIAGEKIQRQGDGDSKRLIYAAYLGMGDLVETVAGEAGIENTHALLTSEKTHKSLLLASGALNSIGLDRVIVQYKKQGAYFAIEDDGLTFNLDTVPKKYFGSGCPYVKGNEQKANYFTQCADHAVATYVSAREQGMPHSLRDQITRTLRRDS